MRNVWIATLVLIAVLFGPDPSSAQTATIQWNQIFQQIDGFGASSAWSMPSMTTVEADLFFSQTNGIGLSLLRSRIKPDPTGTSGEVTTMQMAKDRGARVWSTPWSPPAAWKSNNSVNNGGSLLASHYQDYATELADYVLNMKAKGINIYAVSIQNEPNYTATWESCIWTAKQFHDFVPTLKSTFSSRGVTAKILLPEESGWVFNLASDTLNDPVTKNMIDIVAGHNYFGSIDPVPQASGKRLWQTEVSDLGAFDGSITSGLKYATQIHNFMTIAQANAWHYWWLKSNNPDNEGLLSQSGQTTKRLYALGNFSKFVRPGYYRMGASGESSVLVSAYREPGSNNFAIVVVNSGPARNETFNFDSFKATSVTPWVTSATLDLASQPAINVSETSFTYSLAANSVTTFVGTAYGIDSPKPPTALKMR